jgi:hypothetical protein
MVNYSIRKKFPVISTYNTFDLTFSYKRAPEEWEKIVFQFKRPNVLADLEVEQQTSNSGNVLPLDPIGNRVAVIPNWLETVLKH